MRIVTVSQGFLGANCYLLVNQGKALIVDPSSAVDLVRQSLAKESAKPCGILLTHGHFDHIVSLDLVRDAFGIPAYIHEDDAEMLSDGYKNAFASFFGRDRTWRPAEKRLRDGDTLTLGNGTVTVLHTPGHSRGSVCYMTDNALLTGDTLFSDTVGRTDLYGGSSKALISSLDSLAKLPADLTIYPGHGQAAKLCDALRTVKNMLL